MDGNQYQTKYELLEDSTTVNPYGSTLNENVRLDLSSNDSSGDMIIRTSSSSSRRWNHITDLDNFFKRIYRYHQSSGFTCIVCREVVGILKFSTIVFLTFMVFCGINFNVYFKNETINGTEVQQTTIFDGFYSYDEAMSNVTSPVGFLVLIAFSFLVGKCCYVFRNVVHYWETKDFVNNALGISDLELLDTTWDEVKKRVIHVQMEQRMCILKEHLTPLDIYHRLLRHINYLIALINQNVVPVKFKLPLVGDLVLYSKAYELNIKLLFFWGSQSLLHCLNFDQLRNQDYRRDVTKALKKRIIILAIANFLLMPFIFIYQILYAVYHYAERIKNEPGSFGGRTWSNYGRLYLRHFNEVDHELNARLNRAHKAASLYMSSFMSPLVALVASYVDFLCKACAGIIIFAGIYDDDIFRIQDVLSILGVLYIAINICSSFQIDENAAFIPDLQMKCIVSHIHYMPKSWNHRVHTRFVRDEFAQLFQYKFCLILEDILSPIATPFILYFGLLPQAKKIIDFFYMFTVEVDGIGHVCSFAQMDTKKHGAHNWQPRIPNENPTEGEEGLVESVPSVVDDIVDEGRTELSLIHFAHMNQDWQPPNTEHRFLENFRRKAQLDGVDLSTISEANHTIDSNGLAPYDNGVGPNQWPEHDHSANQYKSVNGSIARMEGAVVSSQYRSQNAGTLEASMKASSFKGSMYGSQYSEFCGSSTTLPQVVPGQSLSSVQMNRSVAYLRTLSCQSRTLESSVDDQCRSRGAMFQSRSYQRSPSPPLLDPGHEALLSRVHFSDSQALRPPPPNFQYSHEHSDDDDSTQGSPLLPGLEDSHPFR